MCRMFLLPVYTIERFKMAKISDGRPSVNYDSIIISIADMKANMKAKILEKGDGAWLSTHEILGVIEEERHELVEAIISNDLVHTKEELLDIATACIFGAACIHERKVHW